MFTDKYVSYICSHSFHLHQHGRSSCHLSKYIWNQLWLASFPSAEFTCGLRVSLSWAFSSASSLISPSKHSSAQSFLSSSSHLSLSLAPFNSPLQVHFKVSATPSSSPHLSLFAFLAFSLPFLSSLLLFSPLLPSFLFESPLCSFTSS